MKDIWIFIKYLLKQNTVNIFIDWKSFFKLKTALMFCIFTIIFLIFWERYLAAKLILLLTVIVWIWKEYIGGEWKAQERKDIEKSLKVEK